MTYENGFQDRNSYVIQSSHRLLGPVQLNSLLSHWPHLLISSSLTLPPGTQQACSHFRVFALTVPTSFPPLGFHLDVIISGMTFPGHPHQSCNPFHPDSPRLPSLLHFSFQQLSPSSILNILLIKFIICLLLLKYKLHNHWEFFSVLYPQHLEQSLGHKNF